MFVCAECGYSSPNPGHCTADGSSLHPVGDDHLLGKMVGSYRIATVLGQGGMGRVYKAVHPGIGSRVAVKVLGAQFSTNQGLIERFFAEARAVNVVRHENIVNVLDLAHLPDGRPYIVMEYLDGGPLSGVIQTMGTLPIGTTLQLMAGVLSGLEAAHASGIIHRDLKPDNIFVSPSGRPKVLDFGIAKLRPDLGGVSDGTREGSLLGTPHYMSPEQARAQSVDVRTDVYSAGVIIFECLTGHRPFNAASLFELLRAHVEQPPPRPTSLRPDMPPAVEHAVLRAMAKNPDERFQSATEFRQALEHLLHMLGPDSFATLAPGSHTLQSGYSAHQPRTPGAYGTPRHAALTPASRASPSGSTEPKRESRFGYFAVGTCGVITLAGMGSCVACIYISNESADRNKVVVNHGGEVSVYDPTKFDGAAFASRAGALARNKALDSKLVSVEIVGRLNSFALNIKSVPGGIARYHYRGASTCTLVEVSKTGVSSSPVALTECRGVPLPVPRCSPQDLYEAVRKRSGPASASVRMRYEMHAKEPSWHVTAAGFEAFIPDPCGHP